MESPLLMIGQSIHLFNMQVTELPLIIDARSPAIYKQSHVIGALNVYYHVDNYHTITNNDLRDIYDSIESQLVDHIIDNSCDASIKICIYDDMDANVLEDVDLGTIDPTSLLNKKPTVVGFSKYIIDYINDMGIPRCIDKQNMIRYYLPREIVFIPNYSQIIPTELPYIVIKDSTLRFDPHCSIINDEHVLFPSMILPWGLFLGSKMNVNFIRTLTILQITTIINVSDDVPNYFQGMKDATGGTDSDMFEYHRFECSDDCRQPMNIIWEQASAIIEDCRIHGRIVIVHCHAGRSRSASTIMYYLMKYQHMGLQEAYDYCQSCRDVVNPNPGFMFQLRDIFK